MIPGSLEYEIHRRDRPGDLHGGVLIATKQFLQLGEVKVSTSIKLLSATVKVDKSKVHAAAYYRPPNKSDEPYLGEVTAEFSLLKSNAKKCVLLIGGNHNLPDINWRDLTILSTQYPIRLNKTFHHIVADNSLDQIVDSPTRKDKTLELILTSHPSFKHKCKPMSSIGSSDHDLVLLDNSIKTTRLKPPRRNIYLWKRADVQGITADLRDLNIITQEHQDFDQSWQSLKTAILNTIEKRVPSMITSSKHTNPWMNTKIKRTI